MTSDGPADELERRRREGLDGPARRAGQPPAGETGRVDPAEHRGQDIGILHRLFQLPLERFDDDPLGPRPLPRPRR